MLEDLPSIPEAEYPAYARRRLEELLYVYRDILRKLRSPDEWQTGCAQARLLLHARVRKLGRSELTHLLDEATAAAGQWGDAETEVQKLSVPPREGPGRLEASIVYLVDEAVALEQQYANIPNLTFAHVWPHRKIWQ